MAMCVSRGIITDKKEKFCSDKCKDEAKYIKCNWCDEECGEGGPKFSNLTKDFCSEDCWVEYRRSEGFIY